MPATAWTASHAWFSHFEAHLARQVITDDRLTQDWQDPEVTTGVQ